MYQQQLPPVRQFPKVPFERRFYAFLIDFVLVWIISSLVTNIFLEFLTFALLWLILRVFAVDRNRGQSLGRWALDMKVRDARFKKRPPLLSLFKREGIICVAAFLAMIGLKITFLHPMTTLLFIAPLSIDAGIAIGDEEYNQAFHDRIADTLVMQTQRGFSLDLRLKKLFNEINQNLKQRK